MRIFAGEYINPAYGTIFMIAPDGMLTTLISFNGTNGDYVNVLTQGRDGNLYGATGSGGPAFVDNPQWGGRGGNGTVFKLATNGALTTLAFFSGTNGDTPTSLVQADNGGFYGTTSYGGAYGKGTVFKVASVNSASVPSDPAIRSIQSMPGRSG